MIFLFIVVLLVLYCQGFASTQILNPIAEAVLTTHPIDNSAHPASDPRIMQW